MKIIFVTGGVRSGKSRFAERLAHAADAADVTYVATSRMEDVEMEERVAKHRSRRPGSWTTVEQPLEVAHAVTTAVTSVVLVECVTLLVSNLLYAHRSGDPTAAVQHEIDQLIASAHEREGVLIIVSNEVGCGVIPMSELARQYCDALGEANQRLAAAAEEVFWLVSGIAVPVKGREGGLKPV